MRDHLEQSKPGHVNEVLMCDASGRLSEGLTSNLFVIQDDTVLTAPLETVLPGTIQRLVIMLCEHLKLPFRFQSPEMNNASRWQGAFITSTESLYHYGRRPVLTINRRYFTSDFANFSCRARRVLTFYLQNSSSANDV